MRLRRSHYRLLLILVCSTNQLRAQQTQLLLPLPKQYKHQFVVPDTFFRSLPAADTATAATVIANRSCLPVNFYSSHLGAACKVELQLEKQTKLPIRIRLGSKEQVDYLEGKFNKHR